MDIPPEERRKIYEEEKSRIEAEERERRQRKAGSDRVVINLEPNVAGLLCYVLAWISGIIFLLIEPKNRFVRFHALQSIIVFGFLHVTGFLLGHLPFIGTFFSVVIGITAFVLWIVLMFKAAQSQTYKLPWAGYLAEKWSGQPSPQGVEKEYREDFASYAVPDGSAGLDEPEPEEPEEVAPPEPVFTPPQGREINHWHSSRWGRITTSGFTIAWSLALLIFFYFFNQYLAFYRLETIAGVNHWIKYPVLTPDFNNWLPILTAVLVVTIIAHIILIVYDRRLLRETVMVVLNALGTYVVASLLATFPFSFNTIPNSEVAGTLMPMIITVALIGMVIGFGIGALVGFVRLIISVVSIALSQQKKTPK
jgi:uncharacterized membrane protein